MKNFILSFAAFAIIGCHQTHQTTRAAPSQNPETPTSASVVHSLERIVEQAVLCGLNMTHSKEATISSDGKTLILPPNKFISIAALESCQIGAINWKTIDSNQGELMDVNETHGLYLSHVIVSTSPSSYLAIVARIGTRENLISLPGAYIDNLNASARVESSFTYFPTNENRARISIDGKYAIPSGETSCDENAYPGIWNIQRNEKLHLSGESNESCAALFEQKR